MKLIFLISLFLSYSSLLSQEYSSQFAYFSKIEKQENLQSFFNEMLDVDMSLQLIKVLDGEIIDLLFIQSENFNFLEGVKNDNEYQDFLYYRYHDIYAALFQYDQIKGVRIRVKNEELSGNLYSVVEDHVTYFPSKKEFKMRVPRGILYKKWYVPTIDYSDVFFENDLSKIPIEKIDDIIFEFKVRHIKKIKE
ncbi:hypothetical protein ACJRPK_04525 [Aquimarina sp. 2-A2]|uniref:hypothetical protein n=1 Tax=Aquimarina sp. 2-A2 TaxID=3382644 RepID=UPI00387F1685